MRLVSCEWGFHLANSICGHAAFPRFIRCDEGFKATSYLLEAAKPEMRNEKKLSACNIAFNFPNSVFQWMAESGWRGRRMGKAMQELHYVTNHNAISGE